MLNQHIQNSIVEAIQTGAYDHQAAEAAGIAGRTFRQWMTWGEEAEREGIENMFRTFAEAVHQARVRAYNKAVRALESRRKA